jgi:hypothetical protein
MLASAFREFSMLRIACLFALAGCLIGPAAAQEKAAQDKKLYLYDVAGASLGGEVYKGRAVITITKKGCRIAWRTPEFAFGTCMPTPEGLVASYRLAGKTGLVSYLFTKEKTYKGVWSVDGVEGRGTETLTFVSEVTDERKALSGNVPSAAALPGDQELFDSAFAIVAKFLEPNANHAALTLALRPSEDDIRKTFKEPLSSVLIKAYAGAFALASQDPIRPDPGQDDVGIVMTTIGRLKADGAVAAGFAPDYDQLRDQFATDAPIATFTFRKRGRNNGKTIDALIYIDGRWVIMPKPYRALALSGNAAQPSETPPLDAPAAPLPQAASAAKPQMNALAQSAVDALVPFLNPQGDLPALTAQIWPKDADIRAVYAEPFASLLIAHYAKEWRPGIAIGPKPGQTEVLVDMTTTSLFIDGERSAGDVLPGGYRRVAQYLKRDIPIGRFKFVKSGERIGLAFDGLVRIGDRWVMIPKPWRALPD